MSPASTTTLPFYHTETVESAGGPVLNTDLHPGICLPQRWTKSERQLEYCKAALIFTPEHLLLVARLEQSHVDSQTRYNALKRERSNLSAESGTKDSATENSASPDSGTTNTELDWTPGKWVSGLWHETVVEAFLHNPELDHYLELHVAPDHQWWLAEFSDIRKRHQTNFKHIPALTWHQQYPTYQKFAVKLPLSALPTYFRTPDLLRANLTAIETSKTYPDISAHGADLPDSYPIEQIEYFSFAKPQTPTPNFHRRELFLPLQPFK